MPSKLIRFVREPRPGQPTTSDMPEDCLALMLADGWAVADMIASLDTDDAKFDAEPVNSRVAILCSGPSLPKTWTAAVAKGYKSVVAVNAAAEIGEVDWWFRLDGFTWDMWKSAPQPRVGIAGCCRQFHGQERAKLGKLPKGFRIVDITADLGDAGPLNNFSCIASIWFAAKMLHATEIDIYGMDLTGDKHFTGADVRMPPNGWQSVESDYLAVTQTLGMPPVRRITETVAHAPAPVAKPARARKAK